MFIEYIEHAIRYAEFELMDNGRYFGTIPQCRGAWADGATIDETRDELASVLESWLIVGMRHGDPIPIIDGIDLNGKVYAEADQVA